jgi:hypothetical protein
MVVAWGYPAPIAWPFRARRDAGRDREKAGNGASLGARGFHLQEKIKTISYDADGGPGDEFAGLINTDIKVYSEVLRAAHLKFE